MRIACAWVAAAGLPVGQRVVRVSAGDRPPLRQEIDQLRRDFEALKQQYGDRLTALESKLAAAEGAAPRRGAAACNPAGRGAAARDPAGRRGAGGRSRRGRADRRAAGLRRSGRRLQGLQSRHRGHRRFPRRRRARIASIPQPALEMHESEASFQAVVDPYARADFFIVVRRGGRRARGRLRHVHRAAGRPADEGRQDARGVRQGQHAAQPRAAVGRSAARHRQPRRRRRRHRRRGHLGGAADSEPVAVPRSDRPGVPRRFGRRSSSRASAAT